MLNVDPAVMVKLVDHANQPAGDLSDPSMGLAIYLGLGLATLLVLASSVVQAGLEARRAQRTPQGRRPIASFTV